MLLKHLHIFLLFMAFYLPGRILSQTLPVGTPVLEDALRRGQLLGKIDPTLSFTSGPLFQESFSKMDIYHPENDESDSIGQLNKSKGRISVLPVVWLNQYNSHHPEGWNDGAMIPSRGYQTLFSAGIYAKCGPLSIQIRPEAVYAGNRNFQGFYKEQPDQVWAGYYGVYNYIDLPERFGDQPYKKLFWGQSSIRLTFGPLSLGLSNENIWWGPGIRNSLMMSNTAEGFKHVTFNTVRPLRTFIGSFEGQLICGRLENSGLTPPDTTRTFNGAKLYIAKRNDRRYFNGAEFSYQPRWVPGLFFGLTRSFIIYQNDMDQNFKGYLPVLSPMSKKSNYGEKESPKPNDQRASFFLRWLWLKAKTELYCEYFREDHAFDTRDFILEAEYEHAYLFGFTKLFSLNRYKGQYIQFNLEITQLAQTSTNPERVELEMYLHYAGIPQGYTHNGQMLGAGIGPGSNLQSLSVSWVQSLRTVGIEVERYVHDNDFQNAVIRDPRSNWVDMSTTAFGEWNYKNFLFTTRLKWVKCYNYQHFYQPVSYANSDYWAPGHNTYNFQGQVGVMYRF